MTGFALKLIAVISMLIDHTGDVLYPGQLWLRYIGRLAFPIYCFLLVEGFCHTRNLKNYMLRLLIFGIISEVPFDLAFHESFIDFGHQNVFWTLLLGLMAISLMSMVKYDNIYIRYLLQMMIAVPFGIAAQLMHTDYRWIGIGLIASMYIFHNIEVLKVGAGVVFMLPFFSNQIEYFGVLSYLPIHFYNGRRGFENGFSKWLFYVFYPVHLMVLVIIRETLWRF
ncbi:MAG: hypothetical protein IJT96_04790 [Lachnospiraceae bacterium]|nr:hypothetical protein [Lachnospiraceae bacterium]